MLRTLLLVAFLALVAAEFTPSEHHRGSYNPANDKQRDDDPEFSQTWGYVNIREGAHTFFWLYYTDLEEDYRDAPIIIWLQGGPGASSTGYGNFEIIGPRDLDLNYRNTTWAHQANILFIDNPVGAGYSYAEEEQYFTTTTQQIADDLMVFWEYFITFVDPGFVDVPLYIFGQSYGGKMGVVFAQTLHQAIGNGEIETNLAGIAMGNAWISPELSTINWAEFAYWMSTTDERGVLATNQVANQCKEAIDNEEWHEATDLWRQTQWAFWAHTNYVDFYNILNFVGPGTQVWENQEDARKAIKDAKIKHLNDLPYDMRGAFKSRTAQDFYERMAKRYGGSDIYHLFVDPEPVPMDPLDDLMNSEEMREYLGIPEHVIWGSQYGDVFFHQEGEFMMPVIEEVDWMLINTNVHTIVYQGQLDIICLTYGATEFVQQLTWPGLDAFLFEADRDAYVDVVGQTDTFEKKHQHFSFYWNLRAGHAVPKDDGEGAFRMLQQILAERATQEEQAGTEA